MADRLAEMEVRTLSDTLLAVLDANTLNTLTERLAEVEVNMLGNIFSKVETNALVEMFFLLAKVNIAGIGKRLAMVEAKMVLDTLAELQYDAEVETLREILVRVHA